MKHFWEKNYDADVFIPHDYPQVTIPALLDITAARYPRRTAIIFEGREISYAALQRQINQVAGVLEKRGVGKGSRVALIMSNCPQVIVGFFAVLRLGGIIVNNISPMSTSREIASIFDEYDIKTAFVETAYLDKVLAVRDRIPLTTLILVEPPDDADAPSGAALSALPETGTIQSYAYRTLANSGFDAGADRSNPGETALFQITGGSSGVLKAAMLTHGNLTANTHQSRCHLGQLRDSHEMSLANMPFIHIYGVTIGFLRPLACGWTVVIMKNFSVRRSMDVIAAHPVTVVHSVPIFYSGISDQLEKTAADERLDFSGIKIAGCGSAPLPEIVFNRFRALTGLEICQGYGLTENAPVAASNPLRGVKKPGSVGMPLPGVDIRILDTDENGKEMPLGKHGEICISGPQVMSGYYNQPGETASTLENGYLHTGDIGFMDTDGYVFISGRKKDMIISSGYNIYPSEIDALVLRHPEVADVCTIGIPDAYRGEALKAYVVLRPGRQCSENEIIDYCKQNIAKFKVPYQVEFRTSLPRDPVAKIRRNALRQEYLQLNNDPQSNLAWHIF